MTALVKLAGRFSAKSDSLNTCLLSHLLFCFFDKTTTSAPVAMTLEKLAFSSIFRRSRQLTSRFTTLPISFRVLNRPVTRECSEMASSSSWEIYRDAVSEGFTRKSDFSRSRSSGPPRHKVLYI